MKSLNIQIKERKVKVQIVDMRNKQVIAPFHLACSHYSSGTRVPICNIGTNLVDDRICCDCNSYDGDSILALDWGNEFSFLKYPFKTQYSFKQIKNLLN